MTGSRAPAPAGTVGPVRDISRVGALNPNCRRSRAGRDVGNRKVGSSVGLRGWEGA